MEEKRRLADQTSVAALLALLGRIIAYNRYLAKHPAANSVVMRIPQDSLLHDPRLASIYVKEPVNASAAVRASLDQGR